MVRSLYSGVSGMKAHQSKMDTIGNNISNVNTYGFKASRVSFSDVFYQSTNSASAPTGNSGGVNPSEIGYGAILGSVDVMHGTSTMATTSNALDVAITGEGFFQVQDSEGNTFYTRAGLLNIDSFGNLVDVNGNFVLGASGDPLGQGPSSNRIQISIPSVSASSSSASQSMNGVNFTMDSSNNTKDANVTVSFIDGSDLPIGQSVAAVITSSGVTVSVNPNSEFTSLEDYNTQVNAAILAANGGTAHPGGTFSLTMNPDTAFDAGNLTGAEILGTNYGVKEGTFDLPSALTSSSVGFGSVTVGTAFGKDFTSDDLTGDFSVTLVHTGKDDDGNLDVNKNIYVVSTEIDDCIYEGIVTYEQLSSGSESLILKRGTYDIGTSHSSYTSYPFTQADGADSNDTITVEMPYGSGLQNYLLGTGTTITEGTPQTTEIVPGSIIESAASRDLGLSSNVFIMSGGTAGGVQGVEDLTGIAVGGDGIIYGNHSVHGLIELGRLDLATFANPQGLTQVGSTYFQVTANSGTAQLATAGTEGTGAIASATLEMSSVDLSGEMADMITTQRGFQACSRMITVSDTMLEELINLKR